MGKIVKWLNEPNLKPIVYIVTIIGIFIYMFMETELYSKLPDIIKLLVYGGILIIGVLTGISLRGIREIAEKLKEVMTNSDLEEYDTIKEYEHIGLMALYKAGKGWDVFTQKQFNQAKVNEIDTLKAKIAELEKK